MELLLVFIFVFFICSSFPLFAKGFAAFLTFGFIAPLFIVGVGSIAWLIGLCTGHELSWLLSCTIFGVPAATAMVWLIYLWKEMLWNTTPIKTLTTHNESLCILHMLHVKVVVLNHNMAILPKTGQQLKWSCKVASHQLPVWIAIGIQKTNETTINDLKLYWRPASKQKKFRIISHLLDDLHHTK